MKIDIPHSLYVAMVAYQAASSAHKRAINRFWGTNSAVTPYADFVAAEKACSDGRAEEEKTGSVVLQALFSAPKLAEEEK